MPRPQPLSIRASYRRSQRISRRSQSSFYRSFWLLPRHKRRAMCALYAFARTTGDLGDCELGDCDQPRALRTHWLKWWRQATEMNFADLQLSTPSIAIPRGLFDDHSERDVKRWPINAQQRVLEIFPALQDAAIQFQIPPGYLLDIVDGVLTRQHKTRFETYEQLEHYSAIAVSSVALACIHIWGFKQPLPTAAALDCGMAFQLTNILRDVSADARRGRIYLPRQHYQQHGLSEDDLLKPRGDDRLVCLIQAEAELAKQLFASGWQVWDSIDEDGRPMFSMMWRSYRRLLERIIENPKAVTERRVRLRRREKIRLRAQHFIGPWFRQLPVPPPLSS